jgi:hypothetical protein
MINGVGMFNPLMMSYTRIPSRWRKTARLPRSFSPHQTRRALGQRARFCAAIWALALRFTFERLISIDLVLYGAP